MSKQQTKSASVKMKYGRRNTGWLKRVRKALKEDQKKQRTQEDILPCGCPMGSGCRCCG